MKLFKKKKDNTVIMPSKEELKSLSKVQRKEVKRQLNEARKSKEAIKKIKTKVANTILDWSDLVGVYDNYMLVGKGDEPEIVQGIKITPHNIFVDDELIQNNIINNLRMAHNRLNFKLYHAFVTSPVDIDEYKSNLYNYENEITDRVFKEMNNSDYNKAEMFENEHQELEFMIFIREKDPKVLDKNLSDLFSAFESCSLEPKLLVKRDFLNYLNWLYENPLCNSFYFSRGIFEISDTVYKYDANEGRVITNKPEEDDEYLKRVVEIKTIDTDDDMKMLLSRSHPTSLKFYQDMFILGDKYCSMIHVLQLPKQFTMGLLCDYISANDIKVFMTSDPYSINMTQMLKKDYNEKEEELYKTKDPTRRNILQQELASQEEYLKETIANSDKTKNLILMFMVCADSEKELKNLRREFKRRLQGVGFQVTFTSTMQEQAFRMVCPVLLDGFLPKVNKENYGFPLPSKAIAGLYPYVFETLKDKYGFLLGYVLQNYGVVIFDHFCYINDMQSKEIMNRMNGNMAVIGKSGSGKSVFSQLVLRNDIKEQFNIVAIDPENKIFKIVKRYNGQIINYGVGNNIINVFDLRPISTDVDIDDSDYDKEKELLEMWNTKNAINHVIGNITSDFNTLFKDFKDEEAAILGEVIRKVYENKGINDVSFKKYTKEQMPTYSDVRRLIDNVIVKLENIKKDNTPEYNYYKSLHYKLIRICDDWGIYFDGTSTINEPSTGGKLIAFGTKHLQNISETKLQIVLKRIMYDYAWSLCIDNEEKSVFFLDEAHTDILQEGIAYRVEQFARRARKYNTCLLLATQEPHDFCDEKVISQGKAIFNNCTYKMCMSLEKDAVMDLSKLIILNETEINLILGFGTGEGLFICGNKHLPIQVLATPNELAEMGALIKGKS